MKRKFYVFGAGLVFLFLLSPAQLFADEVSETLVLHQDAIDMIWLIMAAALVFFMQAGFALVEMGLTRAKNAGNIIMKNLMDFSVGAVFFWAIGWALMYGDSLSGIIGTSQFFIPKADSTLYRDWMFQVVFAATAATIVSGSMAERTKFKAYLVYSIFISGLIYPISGHWIWGGGWLGSMGFHDFAGSTVVHSVGGWAALMGALILGPRIGKYVKVNGTTSVKAIPGHNLPLASAGVFFLWFGWYGFNAGSTLSGTDLSIASVAVTTTLGASGGAIAAMITSWFQFKKPEVSMSLNGALAGLVGITAPTAVVSPLGALIIGLIAGIIVVFSVEFFDKVLHIDDPVGAISVHGVCGVWGTIAVGLFDTSNGFFYTGSFSQLGIQALGVISVFIWVVISAGIVFYAIKKTMGLRVTEDEELTGLDLMEHGSESYSGFQIFTNV
ncbi:MAG: ammonium transporter [Spirochaetia bacterium]|nr:ammonium transporter [Spirochaetia bacterium]MCF7946620.1 ammonium transporter [Spirochaetia bacterium]